MISIKFWFPASVHSCTKLSIAIRRAAVLTGTLGSLSDRALTRNLRSVADQASTNGFHGAAHARVNDAAKERRTKTRFPLRLTLNYRGLTANEAAGDGDTVDISSLGVRFMADQELPVGMKLEVTVRWPIALEGNIPLQLRLFGTILRASGRQTALQIDHHEFRTARR